MFSSGFIHHKGRFFIKNENITETKLCMFKYHGFLSVVS